MIIVVPTQSAIAASSWLLMPNSGQSELMPPSGSMTPWYQEIAPAGDDQRGGQHDAGIPGGAAERRPDVAGRSCSMNRPTRVPASRVVRMNSASNMIAK